MAIDLDAAWVEGYITALDEVRSVVDELLARSKTCIRGGKASSYLAELIKRWPIPDDPTTLPAIAGQMDPVESISGDES